MAKIRIGFSTELNIGSELSGIGTDNPTNTKQVLGNIHATNTKAVGVSTFTTFDGFTDTKARIEGSAGAKQHTTSGEIIIEGTVNVSTGTTFTSGPENLTVTDSFTLPGISDDRPTAGTMRFNENLAALEFYTGVEWRAVNSRVDMGNTGRAVFAGGGSPMEHPVNIDYLSGKIIDYIQIASQGNAINFGELTQFSRHMAGCSNNIRGVIYHGSATPGNNNVIDKITIASAGNAEDFGLIDGTDTYAKSGAASSTRGVFTGGSPAITDIDYVEIMTDGNSKDFGDLRAARSASQSCCDGKRVIVAGGRNPAGMDSIESFMIASKGNVSTEFGELSSLRCNGFGFSNSVRGLFGAGKDGPSRISEGWVESLIIASGGKAVYFGDCFTGSYVNGAASQTRGVFGGGSMPGPAVVNVIEYVTIESAGNSTDFGDLTRKCYDPAAVSDSHGGLGGF